MSDRSAPISCTLFMTDRCNFKCLGCRRNLVGVETSGDMTVATVKKLLSLYPSIRSFSVSGQGEPTLCSGFVDVVDFLKREGKHVGVVTNGTNPETLLSLTCQPDYTSISLYGYDNESYLTYTGVAAYDTVTDGFKRLKGKLGSVGFSYIVTRENYSQLDNLLALCDKLEPDFLHLVNYLASTPENREVERMITVKDAKIIDYLEKVCAGRAYVKVKPIFVDLDSPAFRCSSYAWKINLDGDGNIGGCQRQVPPSARFGNIFQDEDPYNSSEMRRLRRMIRQKSHPHAECRLCFGRWAPPMGRFAELKGRVRAVWMRVMET